VPTYRHTRLDYIDHTANDDDEVEDIPPRAKVRALVKQQPFVDNLETHLHEKDTEENVIGRSPPRFRVNVIV
jgi:hypothetical protein